MSGHLGAQDTQQLPNSFIHSRSVLTQENLRRLGGQFRGSSWLQESLIEISRNPWREEVVSSVGHLHCE